MLNYAMVISLLTSKNELDAFNDLRADAFEKVKRNAWYEGNDVKVKSTLADDADRAVEKVQKVIDDLYIETLGENKLFGFIKNPYRVVYKPTASIDKKGNKHSAEKWEDSDEAIYPLFDLVADTLNDKQIAEFVKKLLAMRNAIIGYGLIWCTHTESIHELDGYLEKMFGVKLSDEDIKAMGRDKVEKAMQDFIDTMTGGTGFKVTIYMAREMLVKGNVIKVKKNGADRNASAKQFCNFIGHFMWREYLEVNKK